MDTVLLLNSPYPRPLKFRGQPTSLLYAASILATEAEQAPPREERLTVSFVDLPRGGNRLVDDVWLSCVFSAARKTQPLLVLVSSSTPALPNANRIARTVKEACPAAIVVLGGPHEDETRGQTVAMNLDVDFSCAGDGEYAVALLAKILRSHSWRNSAEAQRLVREKSSAFADLPGQATIRFQERDGSGSGRGHLAHVSLSGRSLNLDALPFMPRYLLPLQERFHYPIFLDGDRIKATTQVMTRRGCTQQCPFCSESAGVEERSMLRVCDEIRSLKAQGYEAIFFDDSTFTELSSQRVAYIKQLGAELRRLDLEWGCQTRVDTVNEDLLRLLREYGCTYIFLGIESMEDRLLAALGKSFSSRQSVGTLNACARLGIRTGVSLLFGAPDASHRTLETYATADRTLRRIRSYVDAGFLEIVSLNLYAYHPGTFATKAYERVHRELDFYHVMPVNDAYPFSLLEENPSYCPHGLREIAVEILPRADELLGPVIAGQDKYSRRLGDRNCTPPVDAPARLDTHIRQMKEREQ